MGLQVTATSISVSKAFEAKLRTGLEQGFDKKFVRHKKLEVSNLVRHSVNGAQEVIGGILTRGIGPLGSGARTVSYQSPATGKGRRYTTTSWSDLTKPYAARKPRSRVFWRKHFDGDKYPKGRKPLIELFESVKNERHVRSGKTIVVSRSEKWTRLRWNFYLTSYPNILEFMIVEPLLRASYQKGTHFDSPVTPSRDGASMLVWVEGARPFILGLSSQIGADMYDQIRKILRRP